MERLPNWLGVLAVSLVLSASARAQSVIRAVAGTASNQGLGGAIGSAGDVDGDGYPDFLAGDANPLTNGIRVYSGKTALPIWSFGAGTVNPFSSLPAAFSADLDGDGFSDPLVAPQTGAPVANAYSGKTGLLLRVLVGAQGPAFSPLTAFGDLDKDGIPDIAVARYAPVGGFVEIFSGRTGALLRTTTSSNLGFGKSLAPAGDVNKDGAPDFVVGSFLGDGTPGHATLYSGLFGTAIYDREGLDRFGWAVCGPGDVDGDGTSDVLVGAPGSVGTGLPLVRGTVTVLSGVSGIAVLAVQGASDGDLFGSTLAGVGDADLDGRADFAAGAYPNYVRVVSGKTGAAMYTLPASGFSYSEHPLAPAGDLDNDGTLDLLVGIPTSSALAPLGGRVDAWSLVPKGIATYGSGTQGCLGPARMGAQGIPQIGNTNFRMTCDHGSPLSLGVVVVADADDPAGTFVPALGIRILLDLAGAAEILSYDITSDAKGFGSAAAPVPPSAALPGRVYYAQTIWAWPGTCPLPPLGLSSSGGLSIEIQP